MTTRRVEEVADVRPGLVTSGRGAGARAGDWQLKVVSGSDIEDDILMLDKAELIAIEQNARTERHLLQSHDVLVTARSTVVKSALVPPQVSRSVANANLLVVRPSTPEAGLYLWWFFTSDFGRRVLEANMVGGTNLLSINAEALGKIEVSWPAESELLRLADLIELSERAYTAAKEAATLRRTQYRDEIINKLASGER
jgi:hypothetical protein